MHGGLGTDRAIVGMAVVAILVVAPLALWLSGVLRRRRGPDGDRAPLDFLLTVNSAVAFALAYNLTFFVQELFLVLPKALTPGLNPTLFHNNHSWTGDNPIAQLFQGTGAVAVLLTGVMCFLALRLRTSGVLALLVFWMAYHGLFMSLPQLPAGVLNPETDVGDAMQYLGLGSAMSLGLAIGALLAMPVAALLVTKPLLELAPRQQRIATGAERHRFIVNAALLPALIGVALVVPFRWPASTPDVLFLPPLLATAFGVSWIYAGAWLFDGVAARGEAQRVSWTAIVALLALLALFQFVLARGVRFY
jgi:hypothetical protein